MSEIHHFRLSGRPQVASRVVLHRSGSPVTKAIECYTRDIGTGGLFAVTDEKLDVGEQVQVTLSTPSTWGPLILTAEVCWRSGPEEATPGGAGLRFSDLSDAQLLALQRLADSLNFEG